MQKDSSLLDTVLENESMGKKINLDEKLIVPFGNFAIEVVDAHKWKA